MSDVSGTTVVRSVLAQVETPGARRGAASSDRAPDVLAGSAWRPSTTLVRAGLGSATLCARRRSPGPSRPARPRRPAARARRRRRRTSPRAGALGQGRGSGTTFVREGDGTMVRVVIVDAADDLEHGGVRADAAPSRRGEARRRCRRRATDASAGAPRGRPGGRLPAVGDGPGSATGWWPPPRPGRPTSGARSRSRPSGADRAAAARPVRQPHRLAAPDRPGRPAPRAPSRRRLGVREHPAVPAR